MTESNQQPKLSKEEINSVIALYSNGQYQEAINQIKILNETYPNVPLLFNLVGACYKALGLLKGSVKMFETAVNIKPDYAEAHKNLGIVLRDLEKMDKALESLNKAIAIDSNYVDAHYNLAITLKDLNRPDEAVKSYTEYLELVESGKVDNIAAPNLAISYYGLGSDAKLTDLIRCVRADEEHHSETNHNYADKL